MKRVRTILVLAAFAASAMIQPAMANNSVEKDSRPMHEIHSMMIYNFIKYIQWPDQGQEFVIGVLGGGDVYNTLSAWYDGKVRGNKKFVIKTFNSADEISNCHILYINRNKSGDFTDAASKVSSSTLIITDKPGLGKRGSGINFKVANNKLTFELNQSALDNSNLKVSSQLSAMAEII